MESNFKKAFRDVFGTAEDEALAAHQEEEQIATDISQNIRKATMRSMSIIPARRTDRQVSGLEEDCTVITQGTRVDGNITTSSDLVVAGQVRGDINSSNNITVLGTVEGNIVGGSLLLQDATVTGDITVEKSLDVIGESTVQGNLQGGSLALSGQITGDIIKAGDVVIHHDGCLIGDITAAGITIERGAVIRGSVQIDTPPKPMVPTSKELSD